MYVYIDIWYKGGFGDLKEIERNVAATYTTSYVLCIMCRMRDRGEWRAGLFIFR